jgi:hypothetical protein
MLRFLVLLLLAAASAGRAHAFSPEGASASITDFGGHHGFSLGISGVDSVGYGGREERPQQMRAALLSLTWARDGWSVALAGGQMQYVIPGILQGSTRLTGVTISREVTGIAGGALAAEVRAHRLHADDGSTDLLAAALRWTLKF